MKKIIALSMLLFSVAAFAPSAEAKSNDANGNSIVNNVLAPQVRIQVGRGNQRYNRRRGRTVIQTRNVRVGRQLFRETYRVTYLPNGRTRTQLISRVRVGRY